MFHEQLTPMESIEDSQVLAGIVEAECLRDEQWIASWDGGNNILSGNMPLDKWLAVISGEPEDHEQL